MGVAGLNVVMPESVLLVSSAKGQQALGQLLQSVARPKPQISNAEGGAEARRFLLAQDWDTVIINAPLLDENGPDLALLAARQCQASVLLLLKAEALGWQTRLEAEGVLVLPKPLNRATLEQTLAMLRVVNLRQRQLLAENRRLRQKLEEERLIGRAKCLLAVNCRLDEAAAHAWLERTAMNRRETKREVAEAVIRKYNQNN